MYKVKMTNDNISDKLIGARISFGLLGSYSFLWGLTRFFMAIFLVTVGFSGLQIGILMAVEMLVRIISTFIIGKFCDEIPLKYLSTIGLLILSIFYLSISFLPSFGIYMILFVLLGIGGDMFKKSIVNFNIKGKKGKNGYHLGVMWASDTISLALGMIVGGIFLNSFDFVLIFRFTSVGFLFVALMSLLLPKTKSDRISYVEYFNEIKRFEVFVFTLALILFGMHTGAEFTSYTLFLKNNLQLDSIRIGLFTGIPVAFLGISSMIIGYLYDKEKIKFSFILYFGLIISGLGFLLFVLFENPFISFAFRLIHEIGDGAFFLCVFIAYSILFSKSKVGGSSGLIETVKNVFVGISAVAFGVIGSNYGYQYPHIIAGVLMLFAVPLFWYVNRRYIKINIK